MNHDQDKEASTDRGSAASRRKFLRQFGATGAATAALIGITDIVGSGTASAATTKKQAVTRKAGEKARKTSKIVIPRARSMNPDCTPAEEAFFSLSPGNCGGPCPHDYWCMWTYDSACGYSEGYWCVHNPSGAKYVSDVCEWLC
jgi:hypothetical protein